MQNKQIAKKTLHLIDKLGTSLLATKVLGEKPSMFHTDELSVTLDRQTPAKMSGKTLGKGKQKVTLPSAETLFGPVSAKLPSVDSQVGKNLSCHSQQFTHLQLARIRFPADSKQSAYSRDI